MAQLAANFVQDARLALRQFRRAPLFMLLAVSVLALGAGANTAVFSVINAVLLRPLPYPDADRLVWVGEVLERNTADEITLTPNFLDWRRRNHVFTEMAAFTSFPRTLLGRGEAQPLHTVKASAAMFSILQVQPRLGRNFLPSEDHKGQDRVALLSHALWRRSFGGAGNVLGQTIALDDGSYTVVGVLPAGFHFPASKPVDLITPLGKNEALELTRGEGTTTTLRNVIARLKPQVTIQQARTEMELIESHLPPPAFLAGVTMKVKVLPLHDRLAGDLRPALWILFGAVAFLLLLACANIASLLLSRAAARQREIAVRSALGASRGRLARQFMVENLLLAAFGCTGGLVLAVWIRDVLVTMVPLSIPGLTSLPLDYRVFGFAVLLAGASALAFGLIPAFAGSGSLTAQIDRRRQTWLNLLASAQIALAIVLLAGGGLMLQSFWKLRYRDIGLEPNHLLTAQVHLSRSGYPDRVKQAAFLDALLASLHNIPGAESVAIGPLPPGDGHATNGFGIEGRPLPPPGRRPVARQYSVSPEYFRLLGVPVMQGRGLEETDGAGTLPVALISEAFARANFPGENPLGHRLRSERNDGWRTIVGVVAGLKTAGLQSTPEPVLYFPCRQTGIMGGDGAGILIRGPLSAEPLAGELRKRVAQLDASLPVLDIQTMQHRLTESAAKPRLAATLLGSFATLGLLLASVGLYGVMSFLVRSRSREIGIRLAIGAQPAEMTRMILARSLKLILAGSAVGVCAAAGLGRFLSGLLYAVSPHDPFTFGAAIAGLVFVSLAATWLPALQASRIDLAVALRAE